MQEYSNNIAFFPSGKYPLARLINIKPCTYSTATLNGCGLRDTDLTKPFGRMLRRKLQERQKGDITWPLTLGEFLSRIDAGPLPRYTKQIIFQFTNLNLITDMQQHHTSKSYKDMVFS